jgi:hypothetical protein
MFGTRRACHFPPLYPSSHHNAFTYISSYLQQMSERALLQRTYKKRLPQTINTNIVSPCPLHVPFCLPFFVGLQRIDIVTGRGGP